MKNPLILLSLVALTMSCSKGNHTEAKKYKVSAELKSKMINDKIDEELEASRVDTCELEKESAGVFKRTLTKVVLFFRGGDDFDIKFNKNLSQRIVEELRASIFINRAFSPNDFWNLLTEDTAKELNAMLVSQFIKVDNEQFDKVRDLTAFLYLFYFQETERKASYEIGLKNQELEIPKIRVAFEEDASFIEREKLSLCKKLEISDKGFSSNEDLSYPSDVRGKIICDKGDEKLVIEQYLGRGMMMHLKTAEIDHEITFNHSELAVDETRRGAKLQLNKDGDNFEVEITQKQRRVGGSVVKSYLTNTFSSVKVSGLINGENIETKRMSCTTIRLVGYQYDL